MRLDFDVHLARRGFGNDGVDRAVVANGSYFTNVRPFPAIGYQRSRELLSAAERREHGLAPRPLLEALNDDEEGGAAKRGGGVAFEAVIGTDDDQVAVAPGALRRTWSERGRRYFDYAASAPLGDEWAFFSARYAVREARWRSRSGASAHDVAIRIYHDPRHTAHLDRLMRSVRDSLDDYGEKSARIRTTTSPSSNAAARRQPACTPTPA